jgi:hypothetical protein
MLFPGTFRKISSSFPRSSAKMRQGKKTREGPEKRLDTCSPKRPVGRPGVRASEIAGRSYNHRLVFGQIWDLVGEKLVEAQTQDDVLRALELAGTYYKEQFARIPSLILKTVRDSRFPKRRNARINFLADSLAAWGMVSLRRSRDICGEERAKESAKSQHRIIRKEFYIECSCGYKGPALDNACRKCGAKTSMELETMWGDSRLFR